MLKNAANSLWGAVVLAISASSLAGPSTPPPGPRHWESLGSYQVGEGAGIETVFVVIDHDSIRQSGTIFSALVGSGFVEVGGNWQPDEGWIVYSYKIGCRYQTYNELWTETSRGFQDAADAWYPIITDGVTGIAAKKLCAKATPKTVAPNRQP